jgi:hypothetical protein
MIGNPTVPPQRNFGGIARLSAVLSAVLAVGLALTACGGGGGGGPPANARPTIVAAAFTGSGTPVAGDTLALVFSEPVELVPSTLLTDADVTLSGGASLGGVGTAPSQPSSNTLVVTLGPGVSIVPGTTTIALAPSNDAVRDTTGQLGNGGTPVVIGSGDGSAPTITRLTIAAVDDVLNGSGPAGGLLQVPSNGFTIDLAYSDNSAIATGQTLVVANVPVGTAGGTRLPGENLVPHLTTVSATNGAASYRVPSTTTFPNGAVTLTATIVDVSGLASTPRSFAATVRAFTNALRPFETTVNSTQLWHLDFSRDVESFTTTAITGGATVNTVTGSNGRSDFVDLLRVLGLDVATPIPNVVGSADSNAVVLDRIQSSLLADLAALYTGANVTFTRTQPSPAFPTASSVDYNSFNYSQISIAGAPSSSGVLGVAIFDPSNGTQNDNTRTNFSGTRLGVFVHTIVNAGLGPPSTSAFRLTFGPFVPSLGGTPVGSDGQDGDRLSGALSDGRRTAIDQAIEDLARFVAVVTAHECGHSMGLVQNGAMPAGLYGNDATNFPGSVDGHIRNTSLFPTGATNVMSPSLSYSLGVNPSTAFNTLNLAYLREQVFYGN